MKKIIFNFVLIIVFVSLLAVIILPFAAEMEFERAKKLEQDYRWEKAGEKYQAALRLDPFKAEYFSGAGDFLIKQAAYHKDDAFRLKQAEKLYERACQLNPNCAEHWYKLGKAQIELITQSPHPNRHRQLTAKAIDAFEVVIKKDPYNFRNNYLVAYKLLMVWDFLDKEEKSFIIDRLKYVLRSNPWYSSSVYLPIMHYAKDFKLAQDVTPQTLAGHNRLYSFVLDNGLWRYRKKQKELVDFYREKEPANRNTVEIDRNTVKIDRNKAGWQGRSKGETSVYKNGSMYWTGTMARVIDMPEGEAIIKIQAKGSPAYDTWPYMIVGLDGEEIGEMFVNTRQWGEYCFKVATGGGRKILSVVFANDAYDEEKKEDRNLYIGSIRIEKTEIH